MMDDINLEDDEEQSSSNDQTPLIRDIIEFCGGPDLIQIFGETGSGKSTFAVEVADSAVEDADKDVLFIDTERNLGDDDKKERIDYVYIPDWNDIYGYVTGKTSMMSDNPFGTNTAGHKTLPSGYDVVVIDSMGLPALMQYDEYSIADDADQFKVFQMFQHVSGELKKYAQKNDSLIIATNQPGSELAEDGGESPFGDKSQFAFKELWRTYKKSSSSIKTTCTIEAYRSRQAGQGAELFKMEIDDSGVEIVEVDEEQKDEEFMM